MGAGLVKKNYASQMKELAVLKKQHPDIFQPFIFIDPRRIERDKDFFCYKIVDGKVELAECFVKTYIEEHRFCGFKIYPALGYYPFDARLLPLWKYAAEHNIPVMTHCIRGTIFYRGKKEKQWDQHPIFEESDGDQRYIPLSLPQISNQDFSVNFTHPLNYLCVLDEKLLRKVLGQPHMDQDVRELFGFEGIDNKLKTDLGTLKICFAHFGGEDEWKRYFELDRENYSTQIVKNPDVGITFLTSMKGEDRRGKIEQIWKYTDWYSIICSMMLQYENVYSDISYISHDNNIHSLLKRTLQMENDRLRQRVLFGTDFYMVRSHKSEKQILADTIGGLSAEEFNFIARQNPINYLKSDERNS
jgi:predicted TIM-barrel fold metal-dependent hydrolase